MTLARNALASLGVLALAATTLLSCRVYPDGTGGVYVTPNQVRVPSILGLDQAAAARRLQQYSLRTGQVRYRGDAAGQVVVAQNPVEGTLAPAWSYVSYTLGSDYTPPYEPPYEPPGYPTVPFLAGMTQEQARESLADEGLMLGAVRWTESIRDWGTVVEQNPAPGTVLNPGAAVSVVLSSGSQARRIQATNARASFHLDQRR